MGGRTALAISAVSLFALVASAGADPVTVSNAGFEDPVLPTEYTWTEDTPPGWTRIGGHTLGVWHVTDGDFDPVIAPEGHNVAYAVQIGVTGTASGLGQVLARNFAANMSCTLTVEVGNSWDYYWPGYSVQLLAGGIVIAEDYNEWWPEYKKWATSTVPYVYDPDDSGLIGQPLEIRLLNLGINTDGAPYPDFKYFAVEFDAVALDAVPEPATMTMLALMGLGLCARRRKR